MARRTVVFLCFSAMMPSRGMGARLAVSVDLHEMQSSNAACSGIYSGIRGQREQYLLNAIKQEGLEGTEAAQFMAQCAHECDSFNTMTEYASGFNYEGRKDLGNTRPGDGPRFKGRGYIQITGRANYRTYGNIIGEDLENNPKLAERGDIAAKVALAYWNSRVKPRVSDFANTRSVTRLINGGYNGLSDRENKFAQYRRACGGGGGGGSAGSATGVACGGGVAGTCIDTSKSSCPRATKTGLCPGGSEVRCCPNDISEYGACGGGVAGTCIDTSKSSCPRATKTGLCPGGSEVRCCPYDISEYGAGASCSKGTCIDTNKDNCQRSTLTGLCPGGKAIKCCPGGR